MTGYLHRGYAVSLAEFGEPCALPLSGGWILRRGIPGVDAEDAMGCYPIFACQHWDRLADDLDTLKDRLVCLSVVTDPFGSYDVQMLGRMFPDVCFPFKLHYVVDLSLQRESFVHPRHRRKALLAVESVSIERDLEPATLIDEWIRLYANLTRRHSIKGIAAFSKESFMLQLQVPGLVAFRATHAGKTVGMNLWYIQGSVAYYHLGAYDEGGYALGVSFGLFWQAIEYFADRGLQYLSLGAGAGLSDSLNNGLNRFKQGWSTGTRTAYFCGRVFDSARYANICSAQVVAPTTFFPAYRATEYINEESAA